MIYIGVDIGLQGGIAAIDSETGALLEAYKMPLTKQKITDGRKLTKIILTIQKKYNKPVHVIYEELSSFFGIGQKQVVALCKGAGMVLCAVQVAQVPYTSVNPRKWQNHLFAGEKQIFKTVKKVKKLDTKKMALNKFLKIFPKYRSIPVITKNTGNLRDGIVDAGMLAYYGKRLNL